MEIQCPVTGRPDFQIISEDILVRVLQRNRTNEKEERGGRERKRERERLIDLI